MVIMGCELGYEAPEVLNDLNKQGELPQPEPVKPQETPEMQKTKETPEPVEPIADEAGEGGEALGYSSEYWKHEMEVALKNGNRIAYENYKRNYSHAVVRENT